MSNDKAYTGSDIQVLDMREAVRKRPGMYIGGTDKGGLHHLMLEILDNAIDEHMAGYAGRIEVRLHGGDGGTISIKDNGRGIPVGVEARTGKSALEVVFTNLHAGGKFDHSTYKGSGGLHGVGAAVTNFLSESLTARVWRDEKIYAISFARGVPDPGGVREEGVYSKYSQTGTGTEVVFRADPEIFPSTKFDAGHIAEILDIKAYINPGLEIVFRDDSTGTTHTYKHDRGVVDYLGEITRGEKRVHPDPIILEGTTDRAGANLKYTIVLGWCEAPREEVKSFVNSIPTHDGGTHDAGFREGLYRAWRAYLGSTDNKVDIKNEDIREGLFAVINIFYEGDLQFQSQNKVRLNNPEVQPVLSHVVRGGLEDFLYKNPSVAGVIVQRVEAAARARMASRAAQRVSKRSKQAKKLLLPGKLADCASDTPAECELFLVEGDSASGTGKMGRDRQTQAILPLRGKVLNTEGMGIPALLKNKELAGIIEALGCGIGPHFDITALRYRKVILLMDADADGLHIATLLLTFFYRHMPELIRQGHIYLANPPLYRIVRGGDTYWAYSDGERDAVLAKLGDRYTPDISRFKGLGEMMAETLKETTMDPATRILTRVTLPTGGEGEQAIDETLSNLMGKDASKRYDLILENLDLLGDLDF